MDFGEWPSLELVPTYPYTPCIAYNSLEKDIKFACWVGTTWISMVVPGGYAGQFSAALALEPTYPYTPHISQFEPFGAFYVRHCYLSSTTWMSGSWECERLERFGVPERNSMAVEQTPPNTPHISYVFSGTLKHAWLSGTTWLSETVDNTVVVGVHALALANSGNPGIAYYDLTHYALKYAWKWGSSWFSATADNEWGVGDFPSLAFDRYGNPHIAYSDRANEDLKYAHYDDGVWIAQAVDNEGSTGWWPSLALDQLGCPHIGYHYGGTDRDLKYAYIPPHDADSPAGARYQ